MTIGAIWWSSRVLRITTNVARVQLLFGLLVAGQPDVAHESIVLLDGVTVKPGTLVCPFPVALLAVAGEPLLAGIGSGSGYRLPKALVTATPKIRPAIPRHGLGDHSKSRRLEVGEDR